MKTQPVPFDSEALRANIATTAQQTVIPDRYLPLVAAVDGFYGVRAALTETIGEYFHAYRNLDALIDGLQTTLLRNWSYFERSDERGVHFTLLAELALGLFDERLSSDQCSLLLRGVLRWCSAALGGQHGDAYDEPLAAVCEALSAALPVQTTAFLERDALLRDLVARAAERPALAEAFIRLYRQVLLTGYARLEERLDVAGWATAAGSGLTDPAAVAHRFDFLAAGPLRELVRRTEAAPADVLLGPDHPIFSDLLGRAIDHVFRIEELEDRFAVCLFFLKDETLGYRQKEVMVDLLGVVKQLMQPEEQRDVDRILSRLTSFFRGRMEEFLLMRFKCYEAIGVAIGETGNVKAADHLIEDVLSWKFQYPDIRGATDDWEIVVNPYHLPKIRTWMRIIESNPALYERLAAALNVQLRLGGVYIADTDLFQRDVTRFLNADIRPIYFVAKQLLRTLPVYFSQVGAEGELRAVSTQVDEICHRHDTLMHFLRKQCHAESSNRLVAFSRAVLDYWMTLDPSGLAPYVSDNTLAAVRTERAWALAPHRTLVTLQRLCGAAGVDEFLDRLLALTPDELDEKLSLVDAAGDGDGGEGDAARPAGPAGPRRVALMIRTYQLLSDKYSLSAGEVGGAVERHLALSAKKRGAFGRALAAWRARPAPATRDRLLDAALTVLEGLKAIVLDPAASTPVENIYQKRHIAAGIPSIYGNYNEPKFDALGLSFRVENLVGRLFDDLLAEGVERYVTRDTLRRMTAAIRRFQRALAVEGVDSRVLDANLEMLEASFPWHNFTFRQYQNVFQFLVNGVSELSAMSILSHDQVLHTVLVSDSRQCEARGMSVDAVAEMVLRDVLVSALGMQELDRYAAASLRQISLLNGRLGTQALTRMMNYDPERLTTPIHKLAADTDDQRTLGFKGLGLKQMTSYGHNVPEGFIITTELFMAMPAMSYRPLYDDTVARIGRALEQLERQTGLRLGDPGRALLLSIRSGAAISMPGLMTTFVNVGLNDEIAEELAEEPQMEWAAWDAYRRFLQSWAMAAGVDRDFFDSIMGEFKSRYGVEQKLDFTPAQMRELAFTYRDRAREGGVVFVDDPFAQVIACVLKVLESWDSPHARLYRQYIGVAEEWGTAAVVQRMVFGNLDRQSGSGVTFTHNPLEPYGRQVRLFGDFAVQCQGEDLVGGLVFPLPVSEAQRLGSPTYRGTEHSLERDYPEVYKKLLEVARDLVGEREYDPQEIEFTFEGPSGDDLYVLQKRAVVQEQAGSLPYFDTSAPGCGTPVAVGMGVAGGAYAGRVAVNAGQIAEMLARDPGENIVLLRPDTVPEDIAMITQVSAILTARGGATSHAAVTAKRLGKTAVVECMDLDVVERDGIARLAGHDLRAGDWLSIDGRTGNIFLGRVPLVGEPAEPPGAQPAL